MMESIDLLVNKGTIILPLDEVLARIKNHCDITVEKGLYTNPRSAPLEAICNSDGYYLTYDDIHHGEHDTRILINGEYMEYAEAVKRGLLFEEPDKDQVILNVIKTMIIQELATVRATGRKYIFENKGNRPWNDVNEVLINQVDITNASKEPLIDIVFEHMNDDANEALELLSAQHRNSILFMYVTVANQLIITVSEDYRIYEWTLAKEEAELDAELKRA